MENTTRIVDLPENVTIQMPPGGSGSGSGGGAGRHGFEETPTTYTPINVHPNPYGNSIQPNQMPLPEYSGPNRNAALDPAKMMDYLPQEPVRLPSRDIPMDQISYQQDEEIQPNYVPRPKLTGDYIKEYEIASEKKIQKHEKTKKTAEELDGLMTDLQLPLFVALLFFIFSMPIVNSVMFKYLKMLPIFHSDGNLNFYGILMKSGLFGTVFWLVQRCIVLWIGFA